MVECEAVFFLCFKLFWYVDIKNIFLKIKKYYFNIFLNKKYFKNNYKYIFKQPKNNND